MFLKVKELMARPPRAFLLGSIGVGLVLLWLLYVPLFRAIRRTAGQWQQLKSDLTQARQILDSFRQGAFPPLPKSDALAEILEELNTLARSYQLRLLEVTPGNPRPGELKELLILPVELQIEGGYRSLGEFLGALGKRSSLGAASVRRVTIDRQEQLIPRLKARVAIELLLSGSPHGT